MDETTVEALESTIEILQSLNHPNVVQLIDFYEDETRYYLVYEQMEHGDVSKIYFFLTDFQLLNHLETEGYTLSEKNVQDMMTPVFDAVFYCHDLGIIHRDLKPDNMYLTHYDQEKTTLKISDFGIAREIQEHQMATTVAGTPGYLAPEILMNSGYDFKCDYWSLGVVLYFLLSGTLPFQSENMLELFNLIKEGEYDTDQKSWDHVSPEAKNLLQGLLVVDPEYRLKKEQIEAHPWFQTQVSNDSIPIDNDEEE